VIDWHFLCPDRLPFNGGPGYSALVRKIQENHRMRIRLNHKFSVTMAGLGHG
jgi:hypothetical protein